MLWAIWRGQPVCKAIQPSHTVAVDSEKHMTANQSSELTTPRRRVGSAKAARTAAGTAIRLYSGSKASTRNTMVSRGHNANMMGISMCGEASQARQRQIARIANGQVGHRNQGRSRSVLSTS